MVLKNVISLMYIEVVSYCSFRNTKS